MKIQRSAFTSARQLVQQHNGVVANAQNKLASLNEAILANPRYDKALGKFSTEAKYTLSFEIKRKAAVLIPLCFQGNRLSLLFTERSKDLKRNAGQISFPGGQCDPSDENVIQTALRETYEETGISEKVVTIWGKLQAVPDRMLTTKIYPIVGFVDLKSTKISINPQEVNKVFTISLEELCNNHSYTSFRIINSKPSKRDYRTPVYLTEPRIWGLTALMTEILIYKLLDGTTKLYHNPSRDIYERFF